MKRSSLYDETPARGWLPWTWLAPVLCLAFAIATALPIDAWLAHLGLMDAEGVPVGEFGLMGLLTVSFLAWFALVIAWVVAVERRAFATLGLAPPGLRPFLAGLAIGVGTIAGVVALIALAGGYRAGDAFPAFGDGPSLVAIALLLPCFVVQASVEEIIFRGWLLSVVARRRSLMTAIVVSTALFALMHYSRGQAALVTVNLILFGLFACAWSVSTNAIWGAMGWHAGWNWMLATGFELPVSGFDASVPALLVALQPGASDLLTGGKQGPEGSVLCTLFFVIGIAHCTRHAIRRDRAAPPDQAMPAPK